MVLDVRRQALARLAKLDAAGQKDLRQYHARQELRARSTLPSQRRIDAFCALCQTAVDGGIDTKTIIDELGAIADAWPAIRQSERSQVWTAGQLHGIALVAYTAIDADAVRHEITALAADVAKLDRPLATSDSIATSAIRLTALLAASKTKPVTYSDLVLIVRSLNELLPKLFDVPSSPDLDSSLRIPGRWARELQLNAVTFVLTWSERNLASASPRRGESLWTAMHQPNFHLDDKVDAIVLETIVTHAKLQYDLANSSAISTTTEQIYGSALRAYCLASIALDELDPSLWSWLDSFILDMADLDDEGLGGAVVQVIGALAARFPSTVADRAAGYLREIVVGAPHEAEDTGLSITAARVLLQHLRSRDVQEDVVSTLYNFANEINTTFVSGAEASRSQLRLAIPAPNESSSPSVEGAEDRALNVVAAIRVFGVEAHDVQIAALALSVLLQKYERASLVLKQQIVLEIGHIATACSDKDQARTITFFNTVEAVTRDLVMLDCIRRARTTLAQSFAKREPSEALPYLSDLLKASCFKLTKQRDAMMLPLLGPIAALLDAQPAVSRAGNLDSRHAFHNFWFDLVIAGYLPSRSYTAVERALLSQIAMHSPTLALDFQTDSLESDLDSYPTLLQKHEHSHTKRLQDEILGLVVLDTRRPAMSFTKAVYLNAVALLEGLRAEAGVVASSLKYFERPTLPRSDIGGVVTALFTHVTSLFLGKYGPSGRHFDREVRKLLLGCCSHVRDVRQQASRTIDAIVANNPSAVCTINTVTTMLECITLLGQSCYEEHTDRYSPSYEFRSVRTDLAIVVPDSFALRRENLASALRNARRWLDAALVDNAADLRSLLSSYVTSAEENSMTQVTDRGKLLAIEYAMKCSQRDQPGEGEVRDASDAFLGELSLRHLQIVSTIKPDSPVAKRSLLERTRRRSFVAYGDVRERMCSYVSRLLDDHGDTHLELLRRAVEIPFNIFTEQALALATSLWTRIVVARPLLLPALLAEINRCMATSIRQSRGLFATGITVAPPFDGVMEYAPTDKEAIAYDAKVARSAFGPHVLVLQFLSSRLAAPTDIDDGGKTVVFGLMRRILTSMRAGRMSDHVFAREGKLRVLCLAMRVRHRLVKLLLPAEDKRFCTLLLDAALSIFACAPRWAFGSDAAQMRTDLGLAELLLREVSIWSGGRSSLAVRATLLSLLLRHECERIQLWLDPMLKTGTRSGDEDKRLVGMLDACWAIDPSLVVALGRRFPSDTIHRTVRSAIARQPWKVVHLAYALEFVLGSALPIDAADTLTLLHSWAPASPATAVALLLPTFKSHPLVLQYAMRSLESHPVEVTFFYVPQIVQALRYDVHGYVSRFIVETGKLSQLFAHQIIWNFDANAYKDEDAQIPDPIKPSLDRVRDEMLVGLSPVDLDYYEREFKFFGEVTSISGKLKPFIKKSKPEKKAKIDEEMAKIVVDPGVYLPSNPDGELVDIERKSGRPLQSHAKAPFMATFRIRRKVRRPGIEGEEAYETVEKLQSAIFKVGDDCRQDMLALQLISCFRSIFNSVGLDLYVFPYRTTATAPGCGVIDVLPNSVSRDMLGREAVNALYDYFRTTFGEPESVGFQKARMNFVKSLAAYSVISYLLQFKDRHNGNLMYDDQGHFLHIDFGFCFDIAPGGIKFEAAPFKLTGEMIAVMGGGESTQSYKLFQELCIKAFLVSRQYHEPITHLVQLMLDSGLPCFKGETTIRNLRKRFHLDVSEHRAAQVMLGLIKDSYKAKTTYIYDEFQKLTNGIPF